MSRIPYGEDYGVASDLRRWAFDGNIERHLKGKKGQALLRELESAILALPEKSIATGHFVDECGDVCPLGALYVHRRVSQGLPREVAVEDLKKRFEGYEEYQEGGAWEAMGQIEQLLGVKHVFAWVVMEMADERFDRMRPGERYEAVLGWIREKLRPARETAQGLPGLEG